ncbi:MAG: hypothetical protein Q9184_000385 [Pyrenodesmia sp. 2 TL-2023]
MHTGLPTWQYGHIDLRYTLECHPAAVMREHQRMREEMTGLQQPIECYWFGEMYPLSSEGVIHHIACVDWLIGILEGREEQMRRATGGVAGGRASRAGVVFKGLVGQRPQVPHGALTSNAELEKVRKTGSDAVAVRTESPVPVEEQDATRPAHHDGWCSISTTEEGYGVLTGEGKSEGAQNTEGGDTQDWDLCG